MTRLRYLLSEAFIGLKRNVLMTFAVVLSITVSLTLLGASLLLAAQVDLATDEWTGRVEVSIFLCDDRTCPAITEDQQERLREDLESLPVVSEVYFESKPEAYRRFQELFRNQPTLIDAIEPDTLPASFRVKLTDPSQFGVVASQFASYPGVEEVVDQREVLNQFLRFTDIIRNGALIVALIQLLAAGVLIANTIRVAAFARREQTSVMKLVGASNWYIRLPFVIEGVIAGTLGSLISWLLLLFTVPSVTDQLRSDIELMPFIGTPEVLAVAPWMFAAGVGISAMSSIVALRRFLDV
jgi:cell division transport system permease protein